MDPVTGAEVWKSMRKDPRMMAQPEAAQLAMQPFVEALPEVLKSSLEAKVNLECLLRAKVAFLRHCLNNGFLEAIIPAAQMELTKTTTVGRGQTKFEVEQKQSVPASGLSDVMIGMMRSTLELLVESLDDMINDIPALLESLGMTEREVLVNPKVDLSGEALELYDRGELTINELLRLQPSVIINNT